MPGYDFFDPDAGSSPELSSAVAGVPSNEAGSSFNWSSLGGTIAGVAKSAADIAGSWYSTQAQLANQRTQAQIAQSNLDATLARTQANNSLQTLQAQTALQRAQAFAAQPVYLGGTRVGSYDQWMLILAIAGVAFAFLRK